MLRQKCKKLSLLTLPFALATVATSPILADDDDDEIPFAEAHLFFELNNTDGDLGIHALIDGEPWKRLRIEDPKERSMLGVFVRGRLRRQGLTEIFFESAEPTFDELSPNRFFNRFPEGIYEIEGLTLDHQELESETEVTHVMPAPPQALVNGLPMGLQCDDELPGYDAPEVTPPVIISWADVTMSHPDPMGGGAGVQPPVSVDINNYEVVVEYEDDDEFESILGVKLPPDQTSLTIPGELIDLAEPGDAFKFEVLAREVSYNQTATESCFELADYE
jgi:hypothetical protein